jgi:hypothetical protein
MNPVYHLSPDTTKIQSERDAKQYEMESKKNLFESEIEFIDYLDQFKPLRIGSLSSSQIINYHRFMEVKIRKALMPVYFNKF